MFSVVIPLFNKESSIKNTIESVLEQSFQRFEVVVVNDGSTDNSVKVVEGINDERVRLIHQENKGVSVARNRGVKEAQYEWIAFLDGDDLWRTEHLQEISNMIERFPNQKVFVTSFDFSDKRLVFKHKRVEPIFIIENYFKEVMKEVLMWTSIVVVHKSAIDEVGGFHEKLSRGEDRELWARLARKYQIVKSQKITATYNVGDLHSLSKGNAAYYKSIVSVIDLKGLEGYERKYFKRMVYGRLKLSIKELCFSEVLRMLKRHNLQLLL